MPNFESRVHLATVALAAFILSFIIARTYATLFPTHVLLVGGGLHIHHFWFGLVLLAIGGWLGISYQQKIVDIAAAILYGVGGGLIVDEVGLLLTFGDYWSELTWAVLVVLLAFASVLTLIFRFRKKIKEELSEPLTSGIALTFAVFLAAISIGFIAETNNVLVMAVMACLTIVAFLVIIFVVLHNRKKIEAIAGDFASSLQ